MDLLSREDIDGTAFLTLNRPEKRNALSVELLGKLYTSFAELQQDATIHRVVLQSAGETFCAGADLSYLRDIQNRDILENFDDSIFFAKVFRQISEFTKPLIAKVAGEAIAGGCGLILLCDFVIASEQKAKFGFTEVRIGFIPAIVGVYLQKKCGDAVARRLLLTGEIVNAEYAQRMGLVTHLADHEKLDNEVSVLIKTLKKNSNSSISLSKFLLNNTRSMPIEPALNFAASLNTLTRQTADCKSGIKTILEKISNKG